MMTGTIGIGAYQAVYFENVAQAVEFCRVLLPHIVPGPGTRRVSEDRAVVWFHVPTRSQGSTRDGCYLFASTGAIAAAERAGLDTPLSGRVSRAALPTDAVLLFGDDAPPTPARRGVGRRGVNVAGATSLGAAARQQSRPRAADRSGVTERT